MKSTIDKIIKHESFSGILLVGAIAIAIAISNSPLSEGYEAILKTHIAVLFGDVGIDKSLLHWINDGLMAIFFLVIGLEVKYELMRGALSEWRKAALPVIAAIGGIIVPAAIYYYMNQHDPYTLKGWAIPAATDIAFALGVLALIGKGVPKSLKVLLLSIAIIDDIGAIIIIAIFYTAKLSLTSLAIAGVCLLGAAALNRMGVKKKAPYILIGIIMWFFTLKSGIHATLAGVALAFTIPLEGEKGMESPLKNLEKNLYPWVYFAIMPLFAFANSGIDLQHLNWETITSTVSLGIISGLVIGKQLGVFSFAWISVKLGLCDKPRGVDWGDMYGLCILTGIGFTMSLFIGALAFGESLMNVNVRMGVLVASLISAILGFIVLRLKIAHTNKHAQDT